MLKEILQLWLQYLRSDAYKVNKFRLCSNGRYSPLGVLVDALIKEYGEGRWVDLDNKYDGKEIVYKDGYAWKYRPQFAAITDEGKIKLVPAEADVRYRVYLPKEQWFWPGVTTAIQDKIYSWTDSQGYSMRKVADALEDGNYLR